MSDENQNHEEPVIRDKRRIDPETGQVRQPAPDADEATDAAADAAAASAPADAADAAAASAPADADEDVLTVDDILNAAQAEVQEPTDEHLADLKRVTAEYAN
jgi:molecular chaperone GrpE